MSDVNLEKKWMTWYPQEIYLKNIKNNKTTIFYFDKMKTEDFCSNIQNHDIYNKKKELEIETIKTQTYQEAFKKGLLKGQSNYKASVQKLNNLCLSFEKDISNFEEKLYPKLLKIALKISSYVIGKDINIDESILSKNVKKIINKNSFLLNNPKLIIHPDNKVLIENIFKNFLKNNQWTLEYDNSIDVNGCKFISDDSGSDATIDARWNELCRLIFLEEY